MKWRSLRNRIIQGDCLDVLKRMSPASVDLIVTDPPYGMRYRSGRLGPIRGDDDTSWFPLFIEQAYRVLKENSHIYVFCNDYAISDFRRSMKAVGFTPKRTLVWVKNCHGKGDLRGDYATKTEFILYAHKGRRLLNGRRESNVLTFKRVRRLQHPAEKPEDLIGYLISKSSSPGDLVLDPFAGSGTTCAAAEKLGRDYLGVEYAPGYVRIARERLASFSDPERKVRNRRRRRVGPAACALH